VVRPPQGEKVMELRNRVTLVLGVLLALGSSTCRPPEANSLGQGVAVSGKTMEQVRQEHTDVWMAVPGVVGTAIGQHQGRPCILVLTDSDVEQVRQRIPPMVEGHPVVVQYVGKVRALDKQ
jgi:hypothetical protein